VVADIRDMKPGSRELSVRLMNVHEEARRENMTLTQFLEDKDPTHEYGPLDRANGLDAFGRVMRELGIKTHSIPSRGVMADSVEAFARDENTKVAFCEWTERQKRAVTEGTRQMLNQQRDVYGSGDQPQGTVVFPINFDPQAHYPQIIAAVPIAEIVAKTTPITGSSYESFYLTDNTAQKQLARVAEGAEIPAVKLSGTTHTIRVRKFGRRLDATYETLRRMTIDLLALHIQRMMVQAEIDKLAAIIDVAINGDMSNTSNGATVYQLSVLDPTVTPTGAFSMTLKAYLRFKAKFLNPYMITTMLANEDVVVATQLLSTGNANIPLVVMQNAGSPFGGFTPINNETADNVRVGLTSAAPAGKILAFDARFAINRIVETGGDITEAMRWVEKQVQSLVMTTEENYSIIDQLAIKVLDTAS
jgi:hypothetical protein